MRFLPSRYRWQRYMVERHDERRITGRTLLYERPAGFAIPRVVDTNFV